MTREIPGAVYLLFGAGVTGFLAIWFIVGRQQRRRVPESVIQGWLEAQGLRVLGLGANKLGRYFGMYDAEVERQDGQRMVGTIRLSWRRPRWVIGPKRAL